MAELTPQPDALLTVHATVEAGDVPVVVLGGELDSSNVAVLEQHVGEITGRSPPRVVFDLANLRFMDSAGIAVLIATAAQVPLVEVRNPSAILRRILETSGLTSVLRIAP